MESKSVHAELLLGKRVFGLNGRPVGHIEEIRAEVKSNECFITEFLVGSYAAFERLAAWNIGRAVLTVLGGRRKGGYRIPWDQLDLTDVETPRLRCSVSELLPIIEEQ
jgi:sporulation protein YlmC with PRC-barrel domain